MDHLLIFLICLNGYFALIVPLDKYALPRGYEILYVNYYCDIVLPNAFCVGEML